MDTTQMNAIARSLQRIPRLLIVAAGLASSCLPSAADDFYRGKSISLLIGYGPGGGYDVYGRLLARHIGRHIPGNPHIISQNMPGAASLTALRHLEAIAPKDGTVLALFDFVQIVNSVLEPQKTGLNFRNYNWIGSISEDLSVCYAWATRGITTLDQLKALPQVHMGLTAAGDSQDIRLKVLRRLLGVNVKPVAGYPGTGTQYIALERGELDAGCGGWSSLPLTWRTEGKINVLVKLSPSQPQGFPPKVPYAGDILVTEREKSVLRLLSNPAQVGKPVVMSQAVPAERVQTIRNAFAATIKDPQFLADAEKLKVDVSPRLASESMQMLEEIYAMPADVIDAARKVIME
jgi:tripartite-type tricarboxylate transporter receptor subunit TctC